MFREDLRRGSLASLAAPSGARSRLPRSARGEIAFRPYWPGDLRLITPLPGLEADHAEILHIGDMTLVDHCLHAETMTRAGRPVGVGAITQRAPRLASVSAVLSAMTPAETLAAMRRMRKVLDCALDGFTLTARCRVRHEQGEKLLKWLGFRPVARDPQFLKFVRRK